MKHGKIYRAYDVKAKKMVNLTNPQPYKAKNGVWFVKGKSPITGIECHRVVGKTKPTL
jgi:hypothetical protein